MWKGPANTVPVAGPTKEDTGVDFLTSLPSPAIHVPDRSANSYRETSSPWTTPHETNTVASQKQLEGTRISGENNSHSKILASPSEVVAGGRPTITPSKTPVANISKEGWGAHLNEHSARGTWSLPESKLHINYLELKAVFLALKELQDLCSDKIVLIATDNTTVVSYINKEGGMRSGPLCALLWTILTWCSRKHDTIYARHIPGHLNVVADKLSRLGQTIQTEWSLLPEVFQTLCSRWHQPEIDLFAMRFNKLPQFVSPDAMMSRSRQEGSTMRHLASA